jgi:NAD(P)-dependent dehydrogenase (short-subunit alcohol dehydrogenase family)
MAMREGRFAGKRAVVTGASSGIGRATATRLAREGARVALIARGREGLETFGGLDIVVSNAGIELLGEDDRVDRLELAVWRRLLQNNLDGQFLTCKHGIKHLLASGGGTVVCVGSNCGYLGMATN